MCNAINDTEGIAKRIVRIPFEFCRDEVRVPEYAHVTDSGMDLYALDDYTIHPGETVLIPTGIKVALPPGYELQVRPKSGRALKTKLRIANTPGTIDAGYRDEIEVIIENIEAPIKDITYSFDSKGYPVITSIEHGSDMFIGKGEKFAQLVLMEVPKAALFEVSSVQDYGEDREGGFGSTGLK
jgi:dUTP pyrophosphatase